MLPWESMPIHYPPELPISQRREEIIAAIRAHPVIILAGETGSGKTTQLPKLCLEAGLGRKGRIACAQPRRVAALSVARRVAEELGVEYGAEVGAKIRFTDQTSPKTRIKFLTDGMLLSEAQGDPLLRTYDAVIVDEAHERSLNIDFLLGHLKQLRLRRPELRVIVASATIDTEKFSQAFDGAPIIEVSGRVYPVETIYAPLDELLEETGDFTYLEGIAESAQRIHDELGSGDILAFLPTEKDIREAMELLESRFGRRMEIIPCYGRLSNADQQRIFQTSPKRKLILATNIAETSLTIPGIRFVIDTGLARISRYNPRSRSKSLPIVKVSQSSANQRKGRCGRVADGVCIRLYSEQDFEARPLYTVPEIQRANLADVILRMLSARLGDIATFPFIDPPSPASIAAGYSLLDELGALQRHTGPGPDGANATSYQLTELGRKLARLPVDPTVGRMLMEAERNGATEQVLVIAAALSIQDPRERPMDKEAAARQAHARFDHKHSDFLSLLAIWEALHDDVERLPQGRLRKFCRQHFLNYMRLREWRDIFEQLKRALDDFEAKRPSGSASNLRPNPFTTLSPAQRAEARSLGGAEYQSIHQSLLTGLLGNIGRREQTNLYLCPGNRKPLVFPGSSLFIRNTREQKGRSGKSAVETPPKKKGPEWIMAVEIVETSRLYARTVAAIDPSWLLQAGEHLITRSYSDPIFMAEEGRVIARESLRIHGLEIQNKKVSYAKVDPEKATQIFIREALLNEEFEAPAHWSFLPANRQLMQRVQNANTVISVAHWLGVEEAAFRFYQSRLRNTSSIHEVNRLLKRAPDPETSPSEHPLMMQASDLIANDEAAADLSLFPASVTLENSALPIEYRYQPGHERDGITVRLPYGKAKSVDNAMLDWLIPGHLEAKIHALLKALPKDIRQRLLPLAETAKAISKSIRPTGATLAQALKLYLEQAYSIETYDSDWDETAIPEHLRARIEVVDHQGGTLAVGRNLEAVRAALKAKQAELNRQSSGDAEALWRQARQLHERPIHSLPELKEHPIARPSPTEIGQLNGLPLHAYPGLRKAHSGSNPALSPAPPLLALFRDANDAMAANRTGIADLIEYELRRELAWMQSDLKTVERLGPPAVAFRPMGQLKEDVLILLRQTLRNHSVDTLDPERIETAIEQARALSKGLLYKTVDLLKVVFEKRQSLVIQPEIRRQFGPDIEGLMPPDFIRRTPFETLSRLPVYLATIERRPAKQAKDPARYAERVDELQRNRARYAALAQSKAADRHRLWDQPTSLRWMLEEYAISLFAQELGSAYSISAKKLDQAFASAELAAKCSYAQTGSAIPESASAKPVKAAEEHSRCPATDRPTQADLQSLKNLFK